jgi:two-component system chemotaxis response regulator CheY
VTRRFGGWPSAVTESAMPKILIIDDNDDLRDTLVVLLEDQGYSVVAASDGASGVRAFELERPDLVLTDVIMPDSDGIEAIRRIRAIDPKSRIVAMSGGSMAGNDYQLRMAKESGAIEALSKPFEVDELVTVVERCLKA